MMLVKSRICDGEIYTTNQCGELVIVKYVNNNIVHVKFLDTGYETITRARQIRKGAVKDTSLPSVLGKGVVGNLFPTKSGSKLTKEYLLWTNMLKRCYSENFHLKHVSYVGCTVSENFMQYTYFYEWCNSQIGFGVEGFQLDKDILSKGNKIYSEDTCVFVPNEINCLTINTESKRGIYPVGVSYNENTRNYSTYMSAYSKLKYLGRYNTPEQAFLAYKIAKESYIKEVAEKWRDKIDPRVYDALMKWEINIDD